jgi:flavin reductase (DIM6/NTAB) family NADH-FMN oxidoreductase RutF
MTERMKQLGFKEADPNSLGINPFEAIGNRWMLVTAGSESGYNTMTASWGGLGVMWGKNVAVTVIRPQRYTKEFIDRAEIFTLSFYPDDKKSALAYCGANSGRGMCSGEKAANAGLTPLFVDGTTAFEEAELIFVCRKLYESQIAPVGFYDGEITQKCYPEKDFHTAYTAEIIAAYTK